MSNRYKGAVISATPPTTTGGEEGTASGAWTLEQQMQLQAAGLWPAQPTGPYIEDVFSTYLYTGNGTSQTINNGINLSGKGGLVWIKKRNASAFHILSDTARGIYNYLQSNSTDAQISNTGYITSYNSNGFSIGGGGNINYDNLVSWTFRKQPKFFDVVTYTGNGVGGRQIAHNLGVVPGCLMVKVLSEAGGWRVWHRAIPGDTNQTGFLELNSTQEAELNQTGIWAANGITSTYFTASTSSPSNINNSGQTYVAYLFAHNAGGFGLTGTDNVISCGSYTGNGATDGPSINLGYEAQYVLIKRADAASNWHCQDIMRGMSQTSTNLLFPNLSNEENTGSLWVSATSTGFKINTASSGFNASGGTFIYIAIRRGPMRVPTDATKVFIPVSQTGGGTVTTNFPVDLSINTARPAGNNRSVIDRLRGSSTTSYRVLYTNETVSEDVGTGGGLGFDNNTGYVDAWNSPTYTDIYWNFRRAPGFFDEVCYTGTGVAGLTVTHNLTVVPELIIVKGRGNTGNWGVYTATTGNTAALYLQSTASVFTGDINYWNNTSPTSTQFTVGVYTIMNGSGLPYVAYLFATLAGVSKVGSYTGTGAAQTINCGFTNGSRFVLIKRTDASGAWYVWDSARGIIPANDPYLLINSNVAETTGTDYVDTTNVGFDITSTAPADINANGGTFIFLAIA